MWDENALKCFLIFTNCRLNFSGEVFVSSCTQQLHGGRWPMVINDGYSSLWNKNHFCKPNWTIVSIKISYKRCLVNRVQVRFTLIMFECKTSNDFVFHLHRTKHHGSIDALQISKKVKRSRHPASCLQALLFSFVHFLYAWSKLANNNLADFFARRLHRVFSHWVWCKQSVCRSSLLSFG